MQHSFDTKIAKEYGVNSAVILNNLYFWLLKNKANNVNYYDGNYWTYNSTKAFKELFEYMSERQIQHAMQKLIDAGIVITGNYNKVAYDRTLWYAITKKGYSILQNSEFHFTNLLNGDNKNVEPIPDINTDINTDSKPDVSVGNKLPETKKRFVVPTIEEVNAYILEKKYDVDAERFWHFYNAKNWYVGKTKMSNWKSAVATWQKSNVKNTPKKVVENNDFYGGLR